MMCLIWIEYGYDYNVHLVSPNPNWQNDIYNKWYSLIETDGMFKIGRFFISHCRNEMVASVNTKRVSWVFWFHLTDNEKSQTSQNQQQQIIIRKHLAISQVRRIRVFSRRWRAFKKIFLLVDCQRNIFVPGFKMLQCRCDCSYFEDEPAIQSCYALLIQNNSWSLSWIFRNYTQNSLKCSLSS